MKKTMLYALALAGVMMLPMSAGAETADEVMKNMQAASLNVQTMNSTFDVNADIELGLEASGFQGTFPIVLNGTIDLDTVKDPLFVKVNGGFDLNVFGQSMKGSMETYGQAEADNTISVYTKASLNMGEESDMDIDWTKVSMPAGDFQGMTEQIANADLSVFGFELADENAECNGKSCYLLSTSKTFADMLEISKGYMDILGQNQPSEEDLQMAQQFTQGLVFNFKYWVDKETNLPAAFEFNMDGSDYSVIQELLSQSQMFGTDEEGNAYPVTLNVKALSFVMNFDYEGAVDTTIPAEALEAKEADVDVEDAGSLLDMVQNAA